MIYIKHYKGRLGNHMFQRAIAETLAKEWDVKVSDFNRRELLDSIIPEESKNNGRPAKGVLEIKDFSTYINFLKYCKDKSRTSLCLNGYFQKSWLYMNHRDYLRSFFQLPDMSDIKIDEKSVAVLIRRGDLRTDKKYNSDIVPLSYYKHCIDKMYKGADLHIFTDSPQDPDVVELLKTYKKSQITGLAPLEDMSHATRFKNIVAGTGSFHWWIAFLSKAENIHYPILPAGWGHRIRDHVDLHLPFANYIHHSEYES